MFLESGPQAGSRLRSSVLVLLTDRARFPDARVPDRCVTLRCRQSNPVHIIVSVLCKHGRVWFGDRPNPFGVKRRLQIRRAEIKDQIC